MSEAERQKRYDLEVVEQCIIDIQAALGELETKRDRLLEEIGADNEAVLVK